MQKLKFKNIFIPLEKTTDFQADGGLILPSAQAVNPVRKKFSNGTRGRSSLTGFIDTLGLPSALFFILNLSGCATTPYPKPSLTAGIPGIYHRVEKGQTLWRISKIYNLELDEIVKVNQISDAANIEIGQLIFLPHAHKQSSLNNKCAFEDFVWPLKGKIIATFGQNYDNIINKGVVIQPIKNFDVVAARPGKIVFLADNFGYFGKTIIIDHSEDFSTVYAKNSEIFVKVGDNVQRGEVIARADRNLHFEIRKRHIAQNPHYYLIH